MEKSSRKKIKKILIIVFACLVGELIFALLVACLSSFIDDYSHENKIIFADAHLKYENTTAIKGNAKPISFEEYNNLSLDFYSICNNRGFIFPKTINKGTITCFDFSEFFYAGGRNIYRTELYLNWKCPDYDCFESENKRLSEILFKGKNAVYCENLFSFPSYVTEYNYESGFEYAILNKDNLTIDYVYLKGIGSIEQIVFEKALAPTNLLKNSSFPRNKIVKGYYSIYK